MWDFDDAQLWPIKGYRPHEFEEFDATVDRARQQRDAVAERAEVDVAEEDAPRD